MAFAHWITIAGRTGFAPAAGRVSSAANGRVGVAGSAPGPERVALDNISSLTNGIKYRVWAKNDAGVGAWAFGSGTPATIVKWLRILRDSCHLSHLA